MPTFCHVGWIGAGWGCFSGTSKCVGGGGGGEQSGIPIKITEKNNCSSLVQVVGMESPLNDELLINNVQG